MASCGTGSGCWGHMFLLYSSRTTGWRVVRRTCQVKLHNSWELAGMLFLALQFLFLSIFQNFEKKLRSRGGKRRQYTTGCRRGTSCPCPEHCLWQQQCWRLRENEWKCLMQGNLLYELTCKYSYIPSHLKFSIYPWLVEIPVVVLVSRRSVFLFTSELASDCGCYNHRIISV